MKKLMFVLLLLSILLCSSCSLLADVDYEASSHDSLKPVLTITDDLPEGFNDLIQQDKDVYLAHQSSYARWNSGAVTLESGRYYHQIWIDGQEDSIWMLMDADTILRGDTITITYLGVTK